MMNDTTHHAYATDAIGTTTCGAEAPYQTITSLTEAVDCRDCLARLELREKLAEAHACLARADADPDAASYWLPRAGRLAEQAADAARRLGMLTAEERPRRLKLDSSGPRRPIKLGFALTADELDEVDA